MTAEMPVKGGAVAVDYDPFADAPLQRVVAATEAQREIWLAATLEPRASLAYNEAVSLHFDGPLDAPAMIRALHAVLARHEALRGTLSADGAQFCIAAQVELPLQRQDLSGASDAQREAAIGDVLRRAVEDPFDLTAGPLLRADLLRLGDAAHLLVLATHHIVCDGWSFGVIVRDLSALYARECGAAASDLPIADSFADFAMAEALHPQSDGYAIDEAYWTGRYAQVPEPLELPLDRARPRQRSFASHRQDRILDGELVSAIKRAGAARGASLFASLLTMFGVLLQRISGQNDLVVGIPAAGQASTDHPGLVGHAVNVLPLRLKLDPEATLGDVIGKLRGDLLDAFEHQRYTFGTLLRRLALSRDPGRLPLVAVLFNLDPGLDDATLGFKDLAARFAGVPRHYENFELFVNAVQVGPALRLECQYNTDLFDQATIARWLDLYQTLLGDLAGNMENAISALPLLSTSALAELRALQPEPSAYNRSCRIESLIFAQGERTPDAIALEFADVRWTYAQLIARARAIACAVREHGVAAGQFVGIALDRGPDMVAALLGVLASGAGYVPLDPAFPRERLDFMAADAGLALLLTETRHAGSIDVPVERSVLVDSIADRADAFGDDAKGDAEAVAYVIYTSGSTGKPKGVCVPHRAVVNFLDSMRREPGLAPGDRLLAVTTLSFDIAVLELLLPLSVGASVVLASREQAMDGRALVELIHSRSINVMQATPATWRVLIDAGWRGHRGFKALSGGESLPADLAAKLVPRCGSLWNMYGPTETTVWSTCARITDAAAAITIGRPIANTTVWILDGNGGSCPIGVPGEIAIGGEGVTLGYLGREELTAERFVVDPFASSDGARLYRTGDRGRWRNDGRIEHLGRLDFQVKVRGFRIELGDIEANLLRHADIARVVAVVREDRPGDQRLVAYLSLAEAATFDERAVRSHLRALLPDYMIPQHFVCLDAIPLLPNGKIDRARLPLPGTPSAAEKSHEGPRNPIEARIAALMESALSLPGIGVHDDFFALGGHSLLAAQLTTRLGREFALPLSLGLLFEHPTVAGLAAAIGQRLAQPADPRAGAIARLSDPTRAPLSLLQKRLWLFEQLNPGSVVYNTPSAHRLRGVLDEAAFERAFVELTSRQSILRTTIERDGGEVIQRIHEAGAVSLFPAEDLSALAPEERERVLKVRLDELTNVPIDLEALPLYRVHMFRMDGEEHVFFFMPHHIIWDGWSFDLFYTEFAELYSACREQREPVLEPPAASYGEFSEWHSSWLEGADYTAQFTRELAHWRERLERLGAPPPLPTDKPRGASLVGRGETEWISVPAELTARMRALGRSVDATLYMALLGAYYALLWRFVGGSNLVVGTPVRVRASADVENIMGLFTNLLPLPLDVDPDESFLALVARVKAVVMRGFASPEVQLEDLMREPGMRELAGTTHFYQAQFSYQDARQRRCNWGGLAQQQVLVFQRAASEDLAIWFLEHGQGMTGGVLYNADLFESETARLFASRYLALLDRVIVDPGQSIAALTSADATEQERVRAFAAAPRTVVESRIESVIEDLAESAPESPALRIDDRVVSRAQLEQRANRIAACLRARKVGSGTVVAICMKHGVDRVAGMLGTLKAGAIGLPLDPAEAVERLSARMQDVGASVLLADAASGRIRDWPRERALYAETDAAELDSASASRIPANADANAPAFVFHAVGATTPGAGSAFTHADLEILLSDIAHRLGLRAGQVLVGTAAAGTAMQAIECLLALGHGLEYAPASAAERMHGGTLSSRVASSQPACVFVSDEALPELALLAQSKTRVPCVVHVGDSLPADTLDRLRTVAHEVWFAGGAACALPFVSLGRMPEADSDLGSAVRPLVWPGLRLLDECDALVPVGSTGRIWMAGPRPFGAIAQTSARRMPGESDADRAWMPTVLSGRWLADGRLGLLDSSGRARPKPQRRDEARAEPVPAGGPLSPAERWLADLWQELLGVDAVDAQDNFFDLGGHSLLAMTLVAQVEERSGVRLGILKLANSSLRALAAELSQDAIENGMRKAPGLRDRALKLFGLRRGPAS